MLTTTFSSTASGFALDIFATFTFSFPNSRTSAEKSRGSSSISNQIPLSLCSDAEEGALLVAFAGGKAASAAVGNSFNKSDFTGPTGAQAGFGLGGDDGGCLSAGVLGSEGLVSEFAETTAVGVPQPAVPDGTKAMFGSSPAFSRLRLGKFTGRGADILVAWSRVFACRGPFAEAVLLPPTGGAPILLVIEKCFSEF